MEQLDRALELHADQNLCAKRYSKWGLDVYERKLKQKTNGFSKRPEFFGLAVITESILEWRKVKEASCLWIGQATPAQKIHMSEKAFAIAAPEEVARSVEEWVEL